MGARRDDGTGTPLLHIRHAPGVASSRSRSSSAAPSPSGASPFRRVLSFLASRDGSGVKHGCEIFPHPSRHGVGVRLRGSGDFGQPSRRLPVPSKRGHGDGGGSRLGQQPRREHQRVFHASIVNRGGARGFESRRFFESRFLRATRRRKSVPERRLRRDDGGGEDAVATNRRAPSAPTRVRERRERQERRVRRRATLRNVILLLLLRRVLEARHQRAEKRTPLEWTVPCGSICHRRRRRRRRRRVDSRRRVVGGF